MNVRFVVFFSSSLGWGKGGSVREGTRLRVTNRDGGRNSNPRTRDRVRERWEWAGVA